MYVVAMLTLLAALVLGSPAWAVEDRQQVVLDTSLQITSFGEDASGELYVVGRGGTVHRLVE